MGFMAFVMFNIIGGLIKAPIWYFTVLNGYFILMAMVGVYKAGKEASRKNDEQR